MTDLKKPTQDIGTSYYCRDCGEHINAKDVPVVVYLVAGVIGGDREVEYPLHPGIEAVLRQPIARRVWCADCAPQALADLLAEKAPEVAPEIPVAQPGTEP